ncbi:HNH endonuclease (plasmid) [Pontibacillus sp. ALD_SL1]|uniref:HNH endonuclease n=1 Tax=Pontibacillus sp. ALD_SL1 TaxID=2777185 RepID=UPI001A974591|nr:HNH endonuclease signature motif containing protein [Pontibacillus sp. ALD_SL1]QST02205.1 HNH endonuclease [Pontibacillus sp. ALD_SL1]
MEQITGMDKRIFHQLKKSFPDGVIGKIEEVDRSLYAQIGKAARGHGKKPKAYIKDLGFQFKGGASRKSSRYDINALRKLREEYSCKLSDLADDFGISRQAIHKKSRAQDNGVKPWQGEELVEAEKNGVLRMIQNRSYSYSDDERVIRLYRHVDKVGQFALYSYNKKRDKAKCLFVIPKDIFELLERNKYVLYDERDLVLQQELSESDMTKIGEDGEVLIQPTQSNPLYNKMMAAARNHEKTLHQYLNMLGFEIDHRYNYIPDAEIIEELKGFQDKDGVVHIPAHDPAYHRLRNFAQNRGFRSFQSFYAHYGFKYERRRIDNRMEDVIERLSTFYRVEGDKVYVSTYDPLYRNLSGYARNRDLSNVTELLESWGFVRIYLEDLPKGYEPYDWQRDLEKSEIPYEEKFREILASMVVEGNAVYIDSQSTLYHRLFVLAVQKGMKLNELLKEWGFERTYERGEADVRERNMEAIENDDEKIRVNERLIEIKEIQGDLDRSETTVQKIERSQSLSREMKKLYSHKCQLCDYDREHGFIPLIEKRDGTYYTEVHHIIPVSEQDEVADDAYKSLDSYENVIVVCAHHHRMLHYHKGGYADIEETEDGGLCFVNGSEERVPIRTNYHLEANTVERKN